MPAVQVPVRVIFGKDVMRERLGEEASAFGARSVLIVTDNTIVRQGFLEIAEDALKSAGIEMRVFDGVSPEPTLELAEDVAAFAREERCDVVVGLGGGSVLDMAKVAAAATTNPDQRASDFLGANKIANPSAKKILVPTTAGTGAEATPFALIVAAGKKKAIASPFNIADIAILDPTLTATMPPRVTASTGMDALSHAIEALMSKGANALTDAFAYEAIQKIAANIEEVFAHGENIDARLEMSIAAFLAGAAFGNAGVVIGHAIAHTIGTRYSQPHGISAALTIPYVIAFNISVPDVAAKMKRAAMEMGEDVSSLSDEDAAKKAIAHVQQMIERLELPENLGSIGVSEDDIPEIADAVLAEKGYLARNPREVNRENTIELIRNMLSGTPL